MEKTPKSKEGWEFNNTKLIKTYIRKLQKRIYLASKNNDIKIVRKLQHTLLKSYYAKALVIQDLYYKHKKKKIRNIIFNYRLSRKNSLLSTSPKRSSLFKRSKCLTCKIVRKIRLEDKIHQNILLLILVPEWKAKFDKKVKNAFFHQTFHGIAVRVLSTINKKPKYILKSSVQKAQQELNSHKLLLELGFYKGKIYKKLKSWLELESIQKEMFSAKVSNHLCLLLNQVLFHKMSFLFQRSIFLSLYNSQKYGIIKDCNKVNFVHHGYEFIALHDSPEIIKEYKKKVDVWLKDFGLQLYKEETYLGYSLGPDSFNKHKLKKEKRIFDFSIFTVQQRIVKENTVKTLVVLIKPSEKECKIHQRQLSSLIKEGTVLDQEVLIYRLNFLIKKWISKFVTVPHIKMRETIVKMDYLLQLKLRRWAKSKTGTLNEGLKKYWLDTNKKWEFSTNHGVKLCTYKECYRLKKLMRV